MATGQRTSQPTSTAAAVGALADALADATSLDTIYAAALQAIRDSAGVDRAAVLLFDDQGAIRFAAWHGLSDEYRRAVEGHTPWSAGQLRPAPIVVPDVRSEASLAPYDEAMAREQIRSMAFVPLLSRARTVGKFVLYWREPHEPTRETLDAALTVAALVSLAIDRTRQNAELHEQQRRTEAALRDEATIRERLTRLAEGAQRLQISSDTSSVTDEVLALARQSVTADGYAVWRRLGDVWRVVASSGLDQGFAEVELPHDSRYVLNGPIVAVDASEHGTLRHRADAYRAAGITSLVSVPLRIRGRPSGTISYYYRQRHEPTDLELRVAQAFSQLAAAAMSSAELYAEQQQLRTRAMIDATRAAFLADASARLSSLEYEQNLQVIASMIVPRFADWCVVHLVEAGELRQLAVAHVDPAKVAFARELHRRYPPRRDEASGIWRVIATGTPELVERIDDTALQAVARDEEHLALLRDVGVNSAMIVPLARGSEVFGALTFVLSGSARRYDESDLEFAQELARRASYAIENARLYRQAQEANRAKDEFLAALSHELRTPLNAILGWASILRAGPGASIDRGLDVIYRNAKVQAQLVEDLLDASRIVSGRMSLDLHDAALKPILEAAIETVVPQMVDKDIELTTSLPDDGVMIRADAARMQQVFWNLLSNAVKFTPRGGRITVTTQTTASEVLVRVTDTGAGIRPESLPFIFDRFRQADASTTRRYRGLGLGLTLSRQLTEMHGGRIAAESQGPGHGATFIVALPLVDRTVKTVPRVPTGASASVLAGMRVLAVDDDPDSLDVLTSILRLHQATVFGATSAVEALEILAKERPDLVISDIAMPEHDGYWLMQQIQRMVSEGAPAVPCIALTAFANRSARDRAIAAGFHAHLSKPFDPDELVSIIKPLIH